MLRRIRTGRRKSTNDELNACKVIININTPSCVLIYTNSNHMVEAMNAYEWRILTQLRENRGKSYTAYQIANYDTRGPPPSRGKPNDYSFDVQMAKRSLDKLASEGYIVKKSKKEGASKNILYSAR
jgi:hypothetical protein